MDRSAPVNFEHAYTLLRLYCQRYTGVYTRHQLENPDLSDPEERVATVLLQVLAVLRARQRWDVSTLSDLAVAVLGNAENQRYIRPLEVDGCVYDILGVVTYIHNNLYDENNLFFSSKDEVTYNAFQSPRATAADTDDEGRTTPTDRRGLRSLLAQLQRR
jgi:hypothetical protein